MRINKDLKLYYKFKEGTGNHKQLIKERDSYIEEIEEQISFYNYYREENPDNESIIKRCTERLYSLQKSIANRREVEEFIIKNSRVPFYLYINYKGKEKSMHSQIHSSRLQLMSTPEELEETPEGENELLSIADMLRIETKDYVNPLPKEVKLKSIVRFYMYSLSDTIAYNSMLFLRDWWDPKYLSASNFDNTLLPYKQLHKILDLNTLFPTFQALRDSFEEKDLPITKYEHLLEKVNIGKLRFGDFIKTIQKDSIKIEKSTLRNDRRQNFLNDPKTYFLFTHTMFDNMTFSNPDSDAIYVMESMNTFRTYLEIVNKFVFKQGLTGYQNTLWYFYSNNELVSEFETHINDLKHERQFPSHESDIFTLLLPPGNYKQSSFLKFITQSHSNHFA